MPLIRNGGFGGDAKARHALLSFLSVFAHLSSKQINNQDRMELV